MTLVLWYMYIIGVEGWLIQMFSEQFYQPTTNSDNSVQHCSLRSHFAFTHVAFNPYNLTRMCLFYQLDQSISVLRVVFSSAFTKTVCKQTVKTLIEKSAEVLLLWESVIVLLFVVRYFMSIQVLQSSWWGRKSWLLCLICLPGVSWWLSGSSSRCHGVVCGLWLWYFLIILTYCFWGKARLEQDHLGEDRSQSASVLLSACLSMPHNAVSRML